MRLMALALAAVAAPAAAANETALQNQADALVAKVWSASLLTCNASAFRALDNRVVIELDHPRYHLAPTHLHAAAIANGYEFQTTAIASALRWRWAPLGDGSKLAWSPWQEGQDIGVRFDEFGTSRGITNVEDGVLQFDLVRKDGQWQANWPLSPLNSEIRPFDLGRDTSAPALTCNRLGGQD